LLCVQPGQVFLGVESPDVSGFENAAGKDAAVIGYYEAWSYRQTFDAAQAQSVVDQGAVPLVTWEPWDWNGGPIQPDYTLASIIDGSRDAFLRTWALGAKAWGGKLFLRFAPEMNGNWRPWAEGLNGNTQGQYVAAWRHVHDLFESVGVTNVTWVWNPTVLFDGSTPLDELYPGDAYVDYVSLDGYNWGSTQSWSTWQSFEQVFDPTLAQLRQLTSKPLFISESGSAELGGDKAEWITDMFAGLRARPWIVGLMWFDYDKETDWRISSSDAARAAFAAGVADPRYADSSLSAFGP
jgi:beta-mannanase